MNVNTTIIVTGAAVLLVLLTGFLVFQFTSNPDDMGTPVGTLSPFESGPIVQYPPMQQGSSAPGQPATEKTLPVKSVSGTMLVRDFMSDPGVWLSADETYVVVHGSPSATSTQEGVPYEIVYFPEDKGIIVSLLEEPLGEVRRDATDKLSAKLGISNAEICFLVAQVTVPRGVNDFYLGTNLGFPGCPGATKFPGDPTF